jgi:hypothetical protein
MCMGLCTASAVSIVYENDMTTRCWILLVIAAVWQQGGDVALQLDASHCFAGAGTYSCARICTRHGKH